MNNVKRKRERPKDRESERGGERLKYKIIWQSRQKLGNSCLYNVDNFPKKAN